MITADSAIYVRDLSVQTVAVNVWVATAYPVVKRFMS